jgi:hypothetical protein
VTIRAEDVTKSTPFLEFGNDAGNFGGTVTMNQPNARLSHLVMDGLRNGIGMSGAGTSVDHVTVENTVFRGIDSNGSGVTVGPGVILSQNGSGLHFEGGSLTVLGGAGADHTSLSNNRMYGLWVHGTGTVTLNGSAIDPAHPDVSDIDADNNAVTGVFFDYGMGGVEAVVLHGLHASGNGSGIYVPDGSGGVDLSVRGSFLGDNTGSAVALPGQAPSYPLPSVFDFGALAGSDNGRNVFASPNQASASNTNAAICFSSFVPVASPIQIDAVGNVFGAIDCAIGGTLTRSATCSGQVDIGGLQEGGVIDVEHCK